ncbi:2-phosphosulfolactate phosphatase [Aneurinibacillus danicus]|uniref:Probable 2-phosphosulfolactate phosphatase n=1 Tax=Aneurinibacillus danicus TaxID=267746 RepID=A0A511VDM9_9BACL|nr:2-phosphosulfolactate phosphatase [Aneurinibacillus danicus]GEN35693.1 putative 2-phosphosulfolactate phosphatase [Aneurinibacillus danicus]
MRIETVQTVEEIRPEHITDQTVIVIDVLRASSTIVAALSSGFASVIPVQTSEHAYALRAPGVILAGERYCEQIAGFDYNNSPTALQRAKHTGERLVLTTTNGTRAIQKAEKAADILIGCFLNATACITKALSQNCDITLYCAGTRGEFAIEDGLAAGLMVHIAKTISSAVHTCDLSELLEAGYLRLVPVLTERLLASTTGKRLVERQYTEDILFCSQIDFSQIVPFVSEKRILLSSSSYK